MLRALILCVFSVLVVAGGTSARTAGGTPAAFVSVERASQLVGVNLTTGRVVARVRVPLTNGDRGGVGAIDSSGRISWWRPVGTFTHRVAFDYYHGRRLWVTDRESGDVVALSSNRNGRVLRRLHGCPGAHDVAFVGTAWVTAACHDADTVAIWSQRTWRRYVRVGDAPHGVAEVVLP